MSKEKNNIHVSNAKGYAEHIAALHELLIESKGYRNCEVNIKSIIALLCDLNFQIYKELQEVQD